MAADSMDLMHWHGQPSELGQPPKCCADIATKAHQRALGNALYTQRREIVLNALAAIDAYWSAASTVLDPEQPGMELVAVVLNQCRKAIRAAGCICPQLDVSTLGEGPGTSMARGFEPNCGLHGGSLDAERR